MLILEKEEKNRTKKPVLCENNSGFFIFLYNSRVYSQSKRSRAEAAKPTETLLMAPGNLVCKVRQSVNGDWWDGTRYMHPRDAEPAFLYRAYSDGVQSKDEADWWEGKNEGLKNLQTIAKKLLK